MAITQKAAAILLAGLRHRVICPKSINPSQVGNSSASFSPAAIFLSYHKKRESLWVCAYVTPGRLSECICN
jgi:hypothetical protein